MTPVNVRYERRIDSFRKGRWQMRTVTPQAISALKKKIESGEIEEVVLVGPNVATGWRVGVSREVRFLERPSVDEQDAAAQAQASLRIVQMEICPDCHKPGCKQQCPTDPARYGGL